MWKYAVRLIDAVDMVPDYDKHVYYDEYGKVTDYSLQVI